MPAATLPILVNIFVAGMFVASFLTIAQLNPGFRHVRWIALSYAVGMLTPLAEFILPFAPWPEPFMIVSYAGIFIGIVLMAPALSLLYGQRPAWGTATAVVLLGLLVRALIWGGPRDVLWYELAYQFPFSMASLLCAWTIVQHGSRTGLERSAAILFGIISIHFLLKPIAASAFGSGATASDYVSSTYATISQASSGILLIAVGLLVLINALQLVVLRDRVDAVSDPLTGLPNRRALHHAFEAMTTRRGGIVAAVAILDLDHFKRINDGWGHSTGDEILRTVSMSLSSNCAPGAMIARLGGEEFAMLMPWQEEGVVRLACEKLRLSVANLAHDGVGSVTVSIGVTPVKRHETLASVLSRADRGLYAAKAAGRNRCVVQPIEEAASDTTESSCDHSARPIPAGHG